MTDASRSVPVPKLEREPGLERETGRGGLAVAFAKLYFIVTGSIQQFALPIFLGLDGYGALASALSLASIAYNPITTSSIQGVSRAVAGVLADRVPAVLRRTLALHAIAGALCALAFLVAAPFVARAMGAPHITNMLRILSAVLLLYGLYTPLIGALNGRRRFVHQAGFDIAAATLRTTGLVAGAALFARGAGSPVTSAEGSCYGFVLGALLVLGAALAFVGVGRSGPGAPDARTHVAFLLPLLAGQLLQNLLFQADLTLIRRFAAEAAVAAGLPATAADPFVGAYRATQLFSFLPFQLLTAVTFVLFPVLASARAGKERDKLGGYVQTGMRIALIIAGAIVSVSSGLAGPLLRLVFGPEAARHAAGSLEILALGFGAFAVFGLLTAVLNGLGRARASLTITLTAFALVVVSGFAWVRGTPLSDELLWKTALATSAGIVLATALAAVLVFREVGGLVRLAVLARVALATAAAIALARALPSGHRLLVLPEALLVALVYTAVLLVSRELGRADLELLRRVVSRRA
jgi:stage V sporulation protein B